jgi:heparan-alpha-glucosaminide N-acetyltransferase
MTQTKRILSIDIMRGLTLFLMLFVNDLYVPGVPKWLGHVTAGVDGMGLADWVFPGFLFMVGVSIPFAFKAREKKSETTLQLLTHIVMRTVSLLIIGVFMVNASENFNAELTGMNKTLWIVSGYVAVFLIWNNYPEDSKLRYLKYAGIVLLIFLAVVFRGGTAENPTFIQKSWWGILGLIGWGYFAAAVTHLCFKDKLMATVMVLLAFLGLNIASKLGLTGFLNPLKPLLGVIINGNVPLIVLSGLVVGILLKKFRDAPLTVLGYLLGMALLSFVLAAVLHRWFIVSKLGGTPSWAMLCTGISLLLFALLFYIIDVKSKVGVLSVFKPAGQNSLGTYLAPDIVYYLLWALPFQVLVYKQDHSQVLAVFGSVVWAFSMIALAALLAKMSIRLKL